MNAGFSQNSGNSKTDNDERAELVSRCERAVEEIKISRRLITEYEVTLKAKETELEKARSLNTLSEEQIGLLEAEVGKIRTALDAERKALAETEAALEEYRKALAKMTKQRNFFRTLTKVLIVTAGIAAGTAGGMLLRN